MNCYRLGLKHNPSVMSSLRNSFNSAASDTWLPSDIGEASDLEPGMFMYFAKKEAKEHQNAQNYRIVFSK